MGKELLDDQKAEVGLTGPGSTKHADVLNPLTFAQTKWMEISVVVGHGTQRILPGRFFNLGRDEPRAIAIQRALKLLGGEQFNVVLHLGLAGLVFRKVGRPDAISPLTNDRFELAAKFANTPGFRAVMRRHQPLLRRMAVQSRSNSSGV